MLRNGWMALLGLLFALALTVRVEEARLGREQHRVQALALQAANVAAERDTTRNVAATQRKIAELLGDSLHVAERLVVQGTQRADALDRAFGRERRARYILVATVDSLSREVVSDVVSNESGDVRRARFDVRHEPYTIAADVAIPAPPDSARMSIDIALDSIPVDLRMGCGAPNRDGVRPATVNAVTPAWAALRFQRLEQAVGMCESPLLEPTTNRTNRQFAYRPLMVGVGRSLSVDGGSSWALFLGGGFSWW